MNNEKNNNQKDFVSRSCFGCCPNRGHQSVVAVERTDNTLKIEYALSQTLEELNDDERVDVAVWLTDIDHEAEKEQIVEAFNSDISGGKLPVEVIDMFQLGDGDNELDGKRIKEIDEAVSTEQMQSALMIKRGISSSIYEEENHEKLNSVFSNIEWNEEDSYVSRYSPYVFTNLSKSDIYEICENEYVSEIYAYSEELEEEDDPEPDPGSGNSISEYSTYQYDSTGITEMRDNNNFTGSGIKIGIFDAEFAKFENVDYLNQSHICAYYGQQGSILNQYTAHGSLVACIIAGDYHDSITGATYVGVVPDADLYLASVRVYGNGNSQVTQYDFDFAICERIENLIDDGVNVINMSLSLCSDSYNSYNSYALWVDHIVSEHNVSFVASAGNSGLLGITGGKYAYNIITVGNCDQNGTIHPDSSYCSSLFYNGHGMYKPDIVAPGTNIYTPAFLYNSSHSNTTNSGTSVSAPIVTGVVAQICDASPTLSVNPQLMKAILLSGSVIKDNMEVNELIEPLSNSLYKGFSRKYGAGMVNVLNAYNAINTSSSFIVPHSVNPLPLTRNIYLSKNQLLRFCNTWEVPVSLADNSSAPIETTIPNPQYYYLGITTPSGVLRAINNSFDSKNMLTFESEESGTYSITIYRLYNNYTNINHGFSISIQEPN